MKTKIYLIVLYTVTLSCILTGVYRHFAPKSLRALFGETVDAEEAESKDIAFDDGVTATVEAFHTLRIDVAYANIRVEAGEDYAVTVSGDTTRRNAPRYTLEEGVLTIRQRQRNIIGIHTAKDDYAVKVTVPLSETGLQKLKLDNGAGRVQLYAIVADEADLDIGVGNLLCEDSTFRRLKLDSGIGDAEIVRCNVEDLKADLGTGDAFFSLYGKPSDYDMKIDNGLGEFKLGEEVMARGEYRKSATTGNGILRIDAGVGKVQLEFLE